MGRLIALGLIDEGRSPKWKVAITWHWTQTIRDFELVVERPEGHTVSFCRDGKVEKVSARSFSAKAKDFIPKRELAVYFFWRR